MCVDYFDPREIADCTSKTVNYRQFHMVKPIYIYWIEDALYIMDFPHKGKNSKKKKFPVRILRVLSHSQ